MKEFQKITLLPRDTNSHGTIFGGVIMSYIDLAGAACCRDRFRNSRFTTVVLRELVFQAPVYVGDLLTLSGEITATGTTSVTVRILASARRRDTHEDVVVTEAELVYVAVDQDGRKTPLQPWER
jgi:acyl-CoA thioesterase YciA